MCFVGMKIIVDVLITRKPENPMKFSEDIWKLASLKNVKNGSF
jgi:hypothetical protein